MQDEQLGKLMLYQLSYCRFYLPKPSLNAEASAKVLAKADLCFSKQVFIASRCINGQLL